jgi:hypothetical protein
MTACHSSNPCYIFLLAIFFLTLLTAAENETCENPETCFDELSSSEDSYSEDSSSEDYSEAIPEGNSDKCGVWVGLSSLPGTGIGMYAGKEFRVGDVLLPVGDIVIPIVDEDEESFFLWDEYTWNAAFFGMSNMGMEEVDAASPGFGAAANSFMDFVNADEDDNSAYEDHELHRSKNAEAGAFSYWHSRMTKANQRIQAGQELFVSYGDRW